MLTHRRAFCRGSEGPPVSVKQALSRTPSISRARYKLPPSKSMAHLNNPGDVTFSGTVNVGKSYRGDARDALSGAILNSSPDSGTARASTSLDHQGFPAPSSRLTDGYCYLTDAQGASGRPPDGQGPAATPAPRSVELGCCQVHRRPSQGCLSGNVAVGFAAMSLLGQWKALTELPSLNISPICPASTSPRANSGS